MEEFEVSYSLDNEQQFWDELEEIVSVQCTSSGLIDNALRTFLHFTTNFKDEYLPSDYELGRCLSRLLDSEIFQANKDYVRIQLVYSLLQEDEPATLYVIASLLLMDGQRNEVVFEMMNREGAFSRLVELIRLGKDEDSSLHRLLMELLYQMSRMQRLSSEELSGVDDEFVRGLFQIIEQLSDDVDDPYHYPVIRVLLVLNEQYMVAATTSADSSSSIPPTNRVVKVLSVSGQSYMTFGENIILLLNRETETSLQLLILKLLYLLFTTKATHEYFYTNDLRVLLDVIIRNLLDLPNELISLRHTYLRVLYPLLAYTQLCQAPYYKRDEIIKVLSLLGGSSSIHFAPADETTCRLIERVAQVPWLKDDDEAQSPLVSKLLGISLSADQTGSSVSVGDIAAVQEKPGVQTPSRKASIKVKDTQSLTTDSEEHGVKIPPPVPGPRRRGPLPPIPAVKLNGNHKKMPPKAPPRRRTRLKETVTCEAAESA